MKCIKCQADNPDTAKFCRSCGQPLQPQSPEGSDGSDTRAAASDEQMTAEEAAPEAVKLEKELESPAEPGSEPEPAAESGGQSAVRLDKGSSQQAAEPQAFGGGVQLSKEPVKTPGTDSQPQNEGEQASQASGDQPPSDNTPQKPKSKVGILIAAIIVGLLAISSAASMMVAGTPNPFEAIKYLTKDPKEIVIEAFENVGKGDKDTPSEQIFGWSEFAKNMTKVNSEDGITLKLKDSSLPEIAPYKNSGIRIVSKQDVKNYKNYANFGVIYGGMDLVNLNFYLDDKEMMASVPELFSKVFVFRYGENLDQQIADSPWMADMDGSEEMVRAIAEYLSYISQFNHRGTDDQPFNLPALWKRYKDGSSAIKDFKAALDVTKAEKKSYTVNGKEMDCRGYQVVVSKDSMIEFLRSSTDFFMSDERLREDFKDYLAMVVRMSEMVGTYGFRSAEDMEAEAWDQVQGGVDEMIDQMDKSLTDVDLQVYVDSKGNLVAVEGETQVTDGDQSVPVAFSLELNGGDYQTQNAKGHVEITSDEDVYSLTFSKNGSYDGNELTCDAQLTANATSGGVETEYDLVYTGTYSKADGGYHMQLEAAGEGDKLFTVSATGTVDELEKGKSFHANIDSLDITANIFSLSLDGEYYFKPLEGEVQTPEGDQLDILAATEDDFNSVAMEFFIKAMQMQSKFQ